MLISRPDFIFGATHDRQRIFVGLSTPWSFGLCVPVVLWCSNMTTEYSIPYKVGLIDVGTKFAQGRLAWCAIAYGKLNSTAGNVVFERRFTAWKTQTLHHINRPK